MKFLALLFTMLSGALAAQTNTQAVVEVGSKKTPQYIGQVEKQFFDFRRGTENAPVYIKLIEDNKIEITAEPKSGVGVRKISNNEIDWNVVTAVMSALGSLVVAWFTISIAVSTKKLWGETQAAGRVSLKSAQAAEKAAAAAENSVQVTREAYIASERPWVSVDAAIASDLFKRPHGIEFGVNFFVKNHGKSPAVNVHIFYEVVTLKIQQDQFGGVRQKITEMAVRGKAGMNMGIQLFPSEEKIIPWVSSLSIDEIESAKKSRPPPSGLLHSFYVVGSVFYQLPFDEKIHQTGFNYYVTATGDPRYPKGSDVPDFAESFPMDRIRLEKVSYYKGTID